MSRLYPEKPLKCETCRHHQGEQFVPSCGYFETLFHGSLIKEYENGYQLFNNGFMLIVFRRLWDRPEFDVLKCRFYERGSNPVAYAEYLRTPEWARKRRLAIKKADFRCERCGSAVNLEVHHLTYDRLGHELLTDLVVLCHNCHSTIHGKAREP